MILKSPFLNLKFRLETLILILGGLLLVSFLGIKPPQHDEGVNGWFIQEILAKGYYTYDPANYHGPLHFYLLFISKMLFGDNLWALRLSAVLFGWGSLYLLISFKKYLGKWTALVAALFAAVSPGMIFYSRYAIHESGLLFFSLLTLLGYFRYIHKKDKKSLIFLWGGFTGMILTKETFIIHFVCFAFAVFFLRILERFFPSENKFSVCVEPSYSRKDVIQISAVCLLALIMFYSGFFLNWQGVTGIFKSFSDWAETGLLDSSQQKGHWKPFIYWLQLFIKQEWPALLGLFAIFPFIGFGDQKHRLISIYALGTFFAYSIIRYKTPWCILQLIWPFLIPLAANFSFLAMMGKWHKKAAVAIVTILTLISLQKAISLNFFNYANDNEMYPHVQTYDALMKIDKKIKDFAKTHPSIKFERIHILKEAYWPISWLFLDFTNQGYYTKEMPPRADAAIIFCDEDRKKRLELRLKKKYFIEEFKLNVSQKPTTVYYDAEIFEDLFASDQPVFEPKKEEPVRGRGINVSYFDNRENRGDPIKREVVDSIDFVWEEEDKIFPAPFGMILEGSIELPESGEYQFFLASDDGSEFYLDGEFLINNGGDHEDRVRMGKRFLDKGRYPFKINYYDSGGGASLKLWWKRPSSADEENIPMSFLYPFEPDAKG